MLLYIDGIVERRSRDLDVGLNALHDAASRCVRDDLDKDITCALR